MKLCKKEIVESILATDNVKRIKDQLLTLLFPQFCPSCGHYLEEGLLCKACQHSIEAISVFQACIRCGYRQGHSCLCRETLESDVIVYSFQAWIIDERLQEFFNRVEKNTWCFVTEQLALVLYVNFTQRPWPKPDLIVYGHGFMKEKVSEDLARYFSKLLSSPLMSSYELIKALKTKTYKNIMWVSLNQHHEEFVQFIAQYEELRDYAHYLVSIS